ncbi:acyltransferase-like protein At1g54570, chloroplastic isoform X2 [Eucalyptus grandis]|uniref:acyltransferase-like protein At1g54570, chloroplastic isoform X2 n=1 Tax=Eucalyptus grandis TaxID=71139 RepID=UPI00192EDBDA|nr:acyltransferase-like protein At1g54570, chloroplastic isoform X2 [Eucalyptus grandis]
MDSLLCRHRWGKDWLLPSQAEGARLNCALQRSQISNFDDGGHFLFLEDGFDLVTIIKGVGFYRRGKGLDYVSDCLPPSPAEIRNYMNRSGTNLFKLLSSKCHVLLYPGGVPEALHRKGEEYKLCWPEQPELVRMVVRFGAKMVPFVAVGEDDFGEVFLDYDEIPLLSDLIQQLTEDNAEVRSNATREVPNQDQCRPLIRPKIPGRFYYCFGKPIETAGWKRELKNQEKCHELYLQAKSEVESCLAYLREKRESDPYRSIFARLMYQATHGSAFETPTFEL